MFSRKSTGVSAEARTNSETFNRLMTLNLGYLVNLTNELTNSILNLDDTDHANAIRDIVKTVAATKPEAAAALQAFVPIPAPEAFNTTSDEAILSNAKKGTDHHTLYKDMLSLSSEEKAQLVGKFGATLTKFATCNLIFLYTEGSKVDADKGIRNMFAFARQALGAALSTTDRNLKLEFFTRVLAELHSETPFLKYQTESFISDVRCSSRYPSVARYDDAAYLAVIKGGVNTANALTLFDSVTLATLENISSTPTYVAGSQGMYKAAAKEASSDARDSKTPSPTDK